MFRYRLELPNPPTRRKFSAATQVWRPGDSIFVRPGVILRVLDVRPGASEDDEPVLVVRPD